MDGAPDYRASHGQKADFPVPVRITSSECVEDLFCGFGSVDGEGGIVEEA